MSIFLVPILKLQHNPLPPKCCKPRNAPQLLIFPLSSPLDSQLTPSRSLGVHQLWLPTQASKLYENPSCVSCLFIGTLPCICHSKKNSWSPSHLSKSMVNKNMKWMTFWIQGFLIINSNSLFIDMDMIGTNALGNPSKTYHMPWKRFMRFINNIQTSPSLLFVELVTRKGGDVMDVNAIEFILLKVHP